MTRAWKNTDGPLRPTLVGGWAEGEVRLVVADGVPLSVERTGEDSFLIHGRGGLKAYHFEGKPSKQRVRRVEQ